MWEGVLKWTFWALLEVSGLLTLSGVPGGLTALQPDGPGSDAAPGMVAEAPGPGPGGAWQPAESARLAAACGAPRSATGVITCHTRYHTLPLPTPCAFSCSVQA